MELALNFSIITGWFPVVVVSVAVASVILAIGWVDGAWKAQLLLGIPVAVILTLLVVLGVHLFQLVPDDFPRTFYLWVWLLLFSLVIGIFGWMKAHWALRTLSVLAVVFTFVAAFTVVNQTYDYYPTLDRLFGKQAANFVDLPQLKAIRDHVRDTGHLPAHGDTISVHIPPTLSKFQASDAYVYLPPVWFRNPEPALPVVELIDGTPGEPSDWTRAGYADSTSTAFAEAHGGVAPMLVMPDPNGGAGDTECVNSSLGASETYLTKDVPAYMRTEFNAATGSRSLAVAGLSEGGTCSLVLSLRNPTIFPTLADYSGYATETYQQDGPQGTTAALFGGSRAAYDAHDPTVLLTGHRYPGLSGWFGAGLQDSDPLQATTEMHRLAVRAGFGQACLLLEPGGHDYGYWGQAFRSSLPWLSWKLGLTPAPTDSRAHCAPPLH